MATPAAVAAFMQITGAPESVAVQKLEEYGGNVNEAVNAHFLEGDRLSSQEPNLAPAPQYNNSGASNRNVGIVPILNAARRFRPSLLLDPNYRRELRDLYNGIGATSFTSRASPSASHPADVTEAPAGFSSVFEPQYQSGLSTTSSDTARNLSSHGLGIHGTDGYRNKYPLPQSNASHVPDAEIEEAMLQAAIEASKSDRGGSSSWEEFDILNDDLSNAGFPQCRSQQEDEDLARAISLSIEDADYLLSRQAEQMALNSLDKAESHSSRKGEPCKGMLEKKETGKILDKKEVRLSKEPLLCDGVITIVVRMPDGRRLEQRFLKTDKLQILFDFVDIVGFGAVKSGTYRLVKSYPRRAYNINDCLSTFNEVGLSNDNEALFLELI